MAKEFLLDFDIPEKKIFSGIKVVPKEILSESLIEKSKTKFKNKKVILYLGYLRRRKGVDYLIKAFSELKNNNVCLIIAGPGQDERRLRPMVKKVNNIYFVGHVMGKEKAKYYSIADIFVLPTLYDSWGLVVNEAMYYGLPIITTNAAASSEIIKKVGNGFVIESKDVDALKDCLNKLLNDDKLRKKWLKNQRILQMLNI